MSTFPGRVGVVQRVLPAYRVQFFDMLARQTQGVDIFAGFPRPDEGIVPAKELKVAGWHRANNVHLLRGTFYLCYQRGLMEWLKNTNADVLVVEANPRYLSTPQAVRCMHARKQPVLGWGLGAPPGGPLARLRAARRLRFLLQFNGLIAYSQSGAAEYQALGFPAERIFVAPNAVAPRPRAALVARPTTGPITVISVGRLLPRKRLDALLHACAALAPGLQPRLVLVGDGPARAELEELAQRVYPQAEFTGHLEGAALEQRFNEAELFVLPGSGGLAIQQAMAHGLPVIVAKGDGSQGDLVRADTGWLVPPGDNAALLAALVRALQDRSALHAMGAQAFKLVQDTYNLEKMVAAFAHALNTVKA